MLILNQSIGNMKLTACERMPRVSKFRLDYHQDNCDCFEGNRLHAIYSTVGSVTHSKRRFTAY